MNLIKSIIKQPNSHRLYVKILVLCLGLSWVVACDKVPKDILTEEQLLDVLMEVHLLEVVMQQKKHKYKEGKDEIEAYYQYIYETHGTTKEIFEKSLAYYDTDFELMASLYKDVYERMEVFKLEVDAGKYHTLTAEEKGADSLSICFMTDTVSVGKDIWQDKRIYRIPEEGKGHELAFVIDKEHVSSKASYTLSFCARVYEDDESLNSKAKIVFFYDQEHRDTLVMPLKETGVWEHYTLEYKRRENEKLRHIEGKLFTHDIDSIVPRHAVFWGISLREN